MAPHHRVDAARRGHPVHRAVGRGRARPHGGLARRHRRQPGMAWRARQGVSARSTGRRRCPAVGPLLVVRLRAGRRAVGCRGGRDVSGIDGARGAADRVPLRRHPGRSQPHRGLQAVVLRLRAAGARATHRACSDAGGYRACVHGDRDGRGARVRARLRSSPQRRAHPFARDALRKRGPDRRAAGADPQRPGRAGRGGDGEPREEPVPRRRQPRPAPAAACDGPVRRGTGRPRTRAGVEAAGGQHSRIRGGARKPVRATPRPVASRCRRSHPRAGGHAAATAVRATRRRFRAAGRRARSVALAGPDGARRRQRPGAARANPAQPRGQRAALHARRRRGRRRAPAWRHRAHRRRRHRYRHRPRISRTHLRRIRAGGHRAEEPCGRARHGTWACHRAPARPAPRAHARAVVGTGARLALFGHRAASSDAAASRWPRGVAESAISGSGDTGVGGLPRRRDRRRSGGGRRDARALFRLGRGRCRRRQCGRGHRGHGGTRARRHREIGTGSDRRRSAPCRRALRARRGGAPARGLRADCRRR